MRLPVKFIHRLAHIAVIAVLSWVPMNLAVGLRPAAAQVLVEFRTALEPYGSFQRVAHWGEVWVPNVARDWRPYTIGRWVYSDDYGWYWVSDAPEAPWGWIAFHYGRWVWIEDVGWAWVPGRDWGPAWVDWRRGGGYVGWAPLPPDDVAVEIRDEPQYWVFCRPSDFLATNIATVFIEPEPVLLRETVVVNETVVIHDRGFAVNPGIEPAFIAASIGRPIPEYQVRPRVLAGTASLPNAIEVRAEDLHRTDFRQDLMRQTEIRATNNAIQPAANVPRPQPLAPNERGRLGQNPPRAASIGQRAPQQPGTLGRAPQLGGPPERGAAGPAPEQQQRGLPQRGATGVTPEQQRGLPQRGANEPGPGQERRLYNRGETGLAPGEQRGQRERGPIGPTPEQQRGLPQRGATGVTPEQQRGPRERGETGSTPEQQRGLPQRGANEPGPGQERRLYNRGETGLAPGEQRGQRERGPVGPMPEQRSLRDRGASGPSIEQQRQIRPPSEGPASRERGAMGSSPGQERQLFNRAPASPAPGPQRGAGERGPSGPASGPDGRDQRRGFEQGR
jgi:hypothetical protein